MESNISDKIGDASTFKQFTPKSAYKETKIDINDPNLVERLATEKMRDVKVNQSEKQLVSYILLYNDIALSREIINYWFQNDTHNIPIDVQLNLIHYMTTSTNEYDPTKFTPDELLYISTANTENLLNLLGPEYKGQVDRASLLFGILTSQLTPFPNIQNAQDRYDFIKSLPLSLVYILYSAMREKKMTLYPPHVILAISEPSIFEPIILSVSDRNVDRYMDYYGMGPFGQEDKQQYFIKEILRYERIFRRGENFVPPQQEDFDTQPVNLIRRRLHSLTARELLDLYGMPPGDKIINRNTLILAIIEEKYHKNI